MSLIYKEELQREADYLDYPFEDLCFSVYLISGTVIPLCFFMSETDEFLSCCVAMEDETEHLYIIPKRHIEYIKVNYQILDKLLETEEPDKDNTNFYV